MERNSIPIAHSRIAGNKLLTEQIYVVPATGTPSCTEGGHCPAPQRLPEMRDHPLPSSGKFFKSDSEVTLTCVGSHMLARSGPDGIFVRHRLAFYRLNVGRCTKSLRGTGSTGLPALRQAARPPTITNVLNPCCRSRCATRALVASRGQEQYR
jgi:hypothetical protein